MYEIKYLKKNFFVIIFYDIKEYYQSTYYYGYFGKVLF